MGLIQTIKFSDFALHKLVRFDLKYLNYKLKKNEILKPIKVKEIIVSYFKGFAFKGEDFSSKGENYVLKGDLFNDDFNINFNKIQYLDSAFSITHKKFKLNKNDIVVSLVGSIGKMVIIDSDYNMLLNQNNISLQVNQKRFNNKFFSYILKQEIQDLVYNVYANSGYSFLSIDDLFNLEIPNIELTLQEKAIKKIEPIEKEIQNLKSQKKEDLEIINDVFSEELGFDWDKFNTLKSKKIFIANLLDFSNNIDVRCSYNFTHKSHQYLKDFLFSKTNKQIKDYIKEPIKLGKSISPTQFDKNGDCYYVSMATIKNYKIELDDSQLTSIEYEKINKIHKLQKNDIVVSRSGVAIGKFALVDRDMNAINADFTIRIRLDENKIIPLLAYYFFRSDFIQELIHFNKKGLQNKNIFPSQIQEFPILDFDLEHQQILVDKIKTQIDTQKDIDEQIIQKQDEISGIIESCINE